MENPIPIHLSRIHFPVTTLGLGRRIGIWLQGCRLHCPGCVSADTWAFGRGETTVGELLYALAPWLPTADGVTISGGEPFDQPAALHALLYRLRERMAAGRDVLVYSGYGWPALEPIVAPWSGLIDVLISEPFIAAASRTLVWRGSDNQQMRLLTPLGEELYQKWQFARRDELPSHLDVAFLENEVWLAGIPRPGALAALSEQLARAGFSSKSSQAGGAPSLPIFA